MRRPSTPSTRLRPLRTPRPVHVDCADGLPVRVRLGRRRSRVVQVREVWQIDDEWWRNPISRLYVDVVLDGGGAVTLFRDLVTRRWYVQ